MINANGSNAARPASRIAAEPDQAEGRKYIAAARAK